MLLYPSDFFKIDEKTKISFFEKLYFSIFGIIEIRQAQLEDLEQMRQVEVEAWGDEAATIEQMKSRINTFPKGNIVAIFNGKVIGIGSWFKIKINDLISDVSFSWDKITNNGFIKKSHLNCGNTAYGVDLSVSPKTAGLGIAKAIVSTAMADVMSENLTGLYLGARVPFFAKWLIKNHPDAKPEDKINEYVYLKHRGKPKDPELKLYYDLGLKPQKIFPNYFPDPDSHNFGMLVYWENKNFNQKNKQELVKKWKWKILRNLNLNFLRKGEIN